MSTQLPPSRLSRPSAALSALGVLALATAVCACDAGDHRGVAVGVGLLQPTTTQAITASITQQSPLRPANVGVSVCAFNPFFTPSFDLVVVTLAPVQLQGVTLHMIDGSVVGGPMIPFPSSSSQFGPMFIPTGVTRVFPFQSSFVCAATFPRSVRASVTFVNRVGVTQIVTVDAPFR